MAGIRIEPPEPFVFDKPDGWPQWKRHFEQFIIASGVSEESELRKVSTLLDDTTDISGSAGFNARIGLDILNVCKSYASYKGKHI